MLIVYGWGHFFKPLKNTHNMAFRSLASTLIIFSQYNISLSFSQPYISCSPYQIPSPHFHLLHNSASQLVACSPKTFHGTCLLLSIAHLMRKFPYITWDSHNSSIISNIRTIILGATITCLSETKIAQSLSLRSVFFGPSPCAVQKHC
jgi:hypothetical protein